MANRYVDLSGDWEAAQTGADHVGNEWKGPYGLQEAGDTVAAGDTVYVKGTADMRRLCVLNLGKDISAAGWVVGDTVKDNNTGLEWEGVYAENVDANSIVVELIAGDVYGDITIANGINNITQVDTTTITSKEATFQLAFDTTPGILASMINYIGVNAVWADDGTRCKLDGFGTNGAAMYLLSVTTAFIQLKNIEFDDSDYIGVNVGAASCLLINVYVHDCDSYGINSTVNQKGMFFECVAKNNGGGGFYVNTSLIRMFGCVAIGNTGDGIRSGGDSLFVACIVHNNSGDGIDCAYRSHMINCVIDGNGARGTKLESDSGLVFGCRFTNNGTYGMESYNGAVVWGYYNFLLNNTTAAYNEIAGSRIEKTGSLVAGTEGYNDRGNDDFNLTTAATLRRTEIALPND